VAELELKRIIEAVLFAADTPVSWERIAEIVGGADGPFKAGRVEVNEALRELSSEYDDTGRVITISKVAGGWQLYCRPEYMKYARDLHKGRIPPRLTQAALETLAIVAYKQPLVRAEIEGIRGVDSSGVLATLLKRNLVTIAGRAPGMGRALMYRTTREFLRYFGLDEITDLPRLEEFAEVLGLDPGDLQMTVEGAEHMALVEGGAGLDVDAVRESGPGESAPSPDAAPTVHTAVDDAPAENEPDVVTRAPGEEPAAHPGPPSDDRPPASHTTVAEEADGGHALGDRAIIQPLDEA
jgi:segregation and condensation protein B